MKPPSHSKYNTWSWNHVGVTYWARNADVDIIHISLSCAPIILSTMSCNAYFVFILAHPSTLGK